MLPVGFLTAASAPDFDPVKDAFDLRDALKSTTNTKTIIKIICGRTNEQRQQIQQQFKKSKSELIQDIKSHTSGNLQKLLVGLLLPTVDFYCQELHEAKKDVFIDTLCTLSNTEIRKIKEQYELKFSASLESKIQSATSGNFKKLLLSLCTAARDESAQTNPAAAKEDAKQLLKAGELRFGTDEKTFIRILTERNYHQLNLIFQEYVNQRKHSLKIGIEKEFSGDIKEALLAIYTSVINKPEFFATRLHKSMVGLGTNDNQLIRVTIMRFQIDMKDIKTAFEGLYKKSLKSWIEGDTSGDYRQALLALIGENK